ncbi:DUF4179 domain-containing protein [Roseburia inulinivorans]|mgnify:FL=1
MKIHDEMSRIAVPEDLNEKTHQSIVCAEKTVQKIRFRKKCAWSAISCLVILVGIITVANPTMAENIPIIGSVFSYIQDVLDFQGEYEQYAASIEEKVRDHGITVSMTEAYCDGENLFISYRIESEKKYTEYNDYEIAKNQIGYEGIEKIKSDDKLYSLKEWGTAGVDGKFVDENTFVGSQYFDLSGEDFPDRFTLEIYIYNITLIAENAENKNVSIWGEWKFSIPIQVNPKDVTEYEVNEWNEGYSIDEVIVTPIITTIKTTHPDIYRDNFNYDVLVYGDENSNEDLTMQGFYDETKGVFKVPTKNITSYIYIYVIDESRMSKKKSDPEFRRELEQKAIVRKVIHLQ